jgi:hypothetical protein
VDIGTVGVDGDGPAYQIQRNVILPRLMGNHSQKMHRLGVLRLMREYLPVKTLRFPQPPGLVVLQRQIEGLLDSELRHPRGNLTQPFARASL